MSRIRLVALTLVVAASAQTGDPAIAAFWKSTLAKLAAEPLDAKIVDTREPLPYRKYRVEYRSLGGVRVRAFLSLPIRGGSGPKGPLRAIVSAPGYGGLQQGIMLDECQRGYAILQVFPRSQGPSKELWSVVPGDAEKLTWNLQQPEGAYYQGAYADVIRGVDYLLTRDDIQHDAIAIAGTSQGGGIALAVAALDPRLKAVVAHVPFLCDVRRAARTEGSLIRNLLETAKMNDEPHLRVLEHFDPLKLAASLRVPVLISAGGRDTTCPPQTIQAVFDRITSVKSLFHDPELPHTSSERFYKMTWSWLDEYVSSLPPH